MLISITLFSCMSLHAKNIVLEFSPEDFRLNYDESGVLSVVSDNLKSFYSEEVEYALPSFMYETELEGHIVPSVEIKEYNGIIMNHSGVLAPKPVVSSIGEHNYIQNSLSPIVDTSNPPKTQNICKVVGYSHLRTGKTKVNLIVFPFIYDEEQSLNLLTRIDLEIEGSISQLEGLKKSQESKLTKYRSLLDAYLKGSSTNGSRVLNSISSPFRPDANQWDYVILTSNELFPAFLPLAEWKDLKGVPTIIIPVDDLIAAAGDAPEEALKWMLMLAYEDYSAKYALLGGDETIIPVKKCYGSVTGNGGESNSDIPSDMFYGCFGGAFNWDGNNNGISGELGDNIDLTPNLYVTRVPVSTRADVDAFVSKILKYEQNPEINHTMLMCGRALNSSSTVSPSDADQKGTNLLTNHISKLWNGKVSRLYDTSSSFAGNADYAFNVGNFMNEFEKGHSFLDIITAGGYYYWGLEKSTYLFTNIQNQKNVGSTFIISTSDNCSAFDMSTAVTGIDQPICEAIMRNPNNGVIGFLGSSRKTWEFVDSSELGPNLQYNAWFYNQLFSNTNEEKNYGKVVALAKNALASASYQGYGPYRWLQFAINPIGDPETPVFISKPKVFSNAYFKRLQNEKIHVYSGVPSSTLCVKSLEDNGKSEYTILKGISGYGNFDMYRETSLCFTKPGYIPYQFLIYNFQNQILKDRKVRGDLVRMGSNTLPKLDKRIVKFQGDVTISSPCVEILAGTEIPKGAKLTVIN